MRNLTRAQRVEILFSRMRKSFAESFSDDKVLFLAESVGKSMGDFKSIMAALDLEDCKIKH